MEADERASSSDFGEVGEITILSEWDPIEKVKHSLAYCFNDGTFAENYVDAIIESAVKESTEKKRKKFKLSDAVLPVVEELSGSYSELATECRKPGMDDLQGKQFSAKMSPIKVFSGWPNVSDFNIKLGLEKLEEYIESWQKSERWMTCVEFLGFESEESSNYFVYEVEFSNPTPTYPIPQATASVFFSLEVPKIVPPPYDTPVQVTYVFETSNVIHIPGKIDFQESWIKDLIRAKLIFFRTLTF